MSGHQETLLPLLTEATDRQVVGKEAGERVAVAMEEWRSQPVQEVVEADTELVVEGRGLQQWKAEVRVAMASWNSRYGGAPGAL